MPDWTDCSEHRLGLLACLLGEVIHDARSNDTEEFPRLDRGMHSNVQTCVEYVYPSLPYGTICLSTAPLTIARYGPLKQDV